MATSLTLHIGTPKSGTTYLQSVLAAGRRPLRRSGAVYPGARYLPDQGLNQQRALYAVAGPGVTWVSAASRPRARRAYDLLVREVRRSRGRAVVSAEVLSFFSATEAAALLADLGAPPAAVRVVVTARDYGRVLPSIWQQNVKNGGTQGLPSWLQAVAGARDDADHPFWAGFGTATLVERWAGVVGADRVVVVPVPRPGADRHVLWGRFAQAAGLPADLSHVVPAAPRSRENRALSVPQAQLLMHLTTLMRDRGYDAARQNAVRARALDVWMNRTAPAGAAVALPGAFAGPVREWAADDARRLAALGVAVSGPLSDLEPDVDDSAAPPAAADVTAYVDDLLALVEHGPAAAPVARGFRPAVARRPAVVDLTTVEDPVPS